MSLSLWLDISFQGTYIYDEFDLLKETNAP